MTANLSRIAESLTLLEAEKVYASKRKEDGESAVAEASEELANTIKAQVVLQDVAMAVQETIHQKLEGVVSKCLSAVFGENAYQFKILFEKKRGKTEARLAFVRGGEEYDPTCESGGGAVDVASFALRIAALSMRVPKPRSVVILDEPFRFLSAEYRPAMAELVGLLAKETGFQFVLVTHSEDLVMGRIVEIG